MKKIASIILMGMVLGLGVENASAVQITITKDGSHIITKGGPEHSYAGQKNLVQ